MDPFQWVDFLDTRWLDPRWRPHWTYYYLEPLLVAWVISFILAARKRHWSWHQLVGMALILYPFVDMGFDIYYSIPTLLANPVLKPISTYALWWTFGVKMVLSFLVPLVGLLIFFERFPFLEAPPEVVRDGAPAMRDAAGVRTARGLRRDLLLGCALVIPVAIAYGGASRIAALLFSGVSTDNEVDYWQNLTPLLVFLLSLAAGLTEEFLFRGLMLRYLAVRLDLWAAALLQAVVFGFVHAGYGNWAHVAGPFVFGLAMAYVTLRLGLGAAILLHVSVDVVAFGFEVLRRTPGEPVTWFLLLSLVGLNAAAFVVFRLEPLRRLWPWSRERARLPLEPHSEGPSQVL